MSHHAFLRSMLPTLSAHFKPYGLKAKNSSSPTLARRLQIMHQRCIKAVRAAIGRDDVHYCQEGLPCKGLWSPGKWHVSHCPMYHCSHWMVSVADGTVGNSLSLFAGEKFTLTPAALSLSTTGPFCLRRRILMAFYGLMWWISVKVV